MSDPYLGEIEIFGFGFAPRNWAFCAGQLLSIQQNQALFSLLGTTYGGNGTTNFALPDLRSRISMGQGNGQGLTPRVIGEAAGETNHTLLATETPAHSHPLNVASTPAVSSNTNTPGNNTVLAQSGGTIPGGGTFAMNIYVADNAPNQALYPTTISPTGGQPHSNMMPYLAINYCICLNGIYPSRS